MKKREITLKLSQDGFRLLWNILKDKSVSDPEHFVLNSLIDSIEEQTLSIDGVRDELKWFVVEMEKNLMISADRLGWWMEPEDLIVMRLTQCCVMLTERLERFFSFCKEDEKNKEFARNILIDELITAANFALIAASKVKDV